MPETYEYRWKLPLKTLIIFDEVHRCRDGKTQNFKLLTSIKSCIATETPVLMLSATASEQAEHTKYLFYLFDIIKSTRAWKQFFRHQNSQHIGMSENKIIHHILYGKNPKDLPYASRIKISDLGDKFPSNQINGQAYNVEKFEEIEKQYKEIQECMQILKQKKDNNPSESNVLVRILRARQKIEYYKIPTMIELAREFLDNNLSVVIFVNFRDSLNIICSELKTDCVICGEQTLDERTESIKLFQTNVSRIIICQIDAGGVGISLHDMNGTHPRASIISPTWSATKLVQALGRIPRAEAKSPCLQRIVFAARTIEEYVCDKLNNKISALKEINDGDLDVFNIDVSENAKQLISKLE